MAKRSPRRRYIFDISDIDTTTVFDRHREYEIGLPALDHVLLRALTMYRRDELSSWLTRMFKALTPREQQRFLRWLGM